MDKDTALIIATSAGAVAAVVAPVISWYLSRERSQRWLAKISPSLKALLNNSTWSGNGTVETGDPRFHGEYETHMHLQVEGKIVFGEYTYEHVKGSPKSPQLITPPTTIQIRGGLANHGHLRLNYQMELEGQIYFGVLFFRIDETQREVIGKWVGYGFHAKDLIAGTARLQKKI